MLKEIEMLQSIGSRYAQKSGNSMMGRSLVTEFAIFQKTFLNRVNIGDGAQEMLESDDINTSCKAFVPSEILAGQAAYLLPSLVTSGRA